MTYRERREAKVARLAEWAEKRNTKAVALHAQNAPYRGDHAFNTQPGHIPERARAIARTERAFEHSAKADQMQARASTIASQLERSIFDDDPDAIERLREKLAKLEGDRALYKALSAALRKRTPAEALDATYSDKLRGYYARWLAEGAKLPSYILSNLGAEVRRTAARITALESATAGTRPLRIRRAQRAGQCERCDDPIEEGAWIGKYADGWSHAIPINNGMSWARCEA